MIAKRITTHLVRHIWEAYAKKYLIDNPDCYGKQHNKIKNYYIFSDGTKKRKVRVQYPAGPRNVITHGMQGLVISYEIFRGIIEAYLDKAKTAVINGEAVHIAHIGKICAKRVERDFTKTTQRAIDWHKTKKQEKVWNDELGKAVYPKYYYFNDDEWCRIGWFKIGIPNESAYEFDPAGPNTHGEGGFRLPFSRALKADPLLKYKYLYSEIKDERRFIAQPETPEECYIS